MSRTLVLIALFVNIYGVPAERIGKSPLPPLPPKDPLNPENFPALGSLGESTETPPSPPSSPPSSPAWGRKIQSNQTSNKESFPSLSPPIDGNKTTVIWGPAQKIFPSTTTQPPSRPNSPQLPRRNSQRRPSQVTVGPKGQNSYTHLVLAIQWVGGTCRDGYSKNRACLAESKRNHWTLHGLWPASDLASPEFCDTEVFDGRKLESIKAGLTQYWPSFTSTRDRYFTFWRHEWQKHGTCAGDIPKLRGLVNYFTNALELFKKHDVKDYLANSNVTPSAHKKYRPSEIVRALSDDFPRKFDVVCEQMRDKTHVLSEVRFCFNKNLEAVDCKGRNIRCANELVYLPA